MPDHADQVDTEPSVSRFTVTDAAGATWHAEVWWASVAGRAGAVRLSLRSSGAAATSTTVRAFEQAMREHTPPPGAALPDGYRADGSAYRLEPRASEVTLPPIDLANLRALSGAEGPAPRGRPRDDDAWRARVEAVRNAWEARQPLLAALERLEPGAAPGTYRARLRGAYAWDREHGGHLLRDVGRSVRPGKGGE